MVERDLSFSLVERTEPERRPYLRPFGSVCMGHLHWAESILGSMKIIFAIACIEMRLR